MRILLVEDEDRIASFVTKGLGSEGHAVDRAATGREAIGLVRHEEYDLVLLDLLLPDANGRDVLRALRTETRTTPVLVLSALGEVEDKVELLDSGANDYLTKPFALAELAARIRALTRQDQERSDTIEVGDVVLDTRTRTVTRNGNRVALTTREFTLLEYLMRHPGQVLSREQLLQAVWGSNYHTSSNVVDVYVRYLRKKLDIPGTDSPIETIRGAGYRVCRD
ncbi:MAG: response regulator transcription factor [Thermoleophilia bacterium]